MKLKETLAELKSLGNDQYGVPLAPFWINEIVRRQG
jgi:hypothetical protein